MKTSERQMNQKSLSSHLIALFFVAGVGLMTYFTPSLQEDLEFAASNWRYIQGLTHDINWTGMWDDIVFHQTFTNGRLGDRLAIPIVCLLPKWLFAALCGGIALLIVNGIIRLVGENVNRSLSVSLIVTLLLLWFPWHDHMFLVSYSVNYLWTACIGVWVAYAVMAYSPKCKWYVLCIEGLLCIIAGMWHELIALTVGSALGLYAVVGSTNAVRGRLILVGCLFIGFVANVLSGGLKTRVSVTDISFDIHNYFGVWHHIPYPVWPLIPIVIYALLLVIWLLSAKLNNSSGFRWSAACKRLLSDRFMEIQFVCIFVMLSNLAIFGFFGHPRTFIWGDIFAIVGIVAFASQLWPKSKCYVRTILVALIGMTGMALVANLYISLIYQIRIDKDFRILREKWLADDDGVMFYDLPPMFLHVNYPWHMVINDMYTATWKHYYLANFIRPQNAPKNFLVIPSTLERVRPNDIVWLNKDLGIYMVNGHMLYSNPDKLDLEVNPANGMSCFGKIHIRTKLVDESVVMFWCLVFPYTTDKGIPAYYIHPLNEGNPNLIDSVISVTVYPPKQTWTQPPTNYGR